MSPFRKPLSAVPGRSTGTSRLFLHAVILFLGFVLVPVTEAFSAAVTLAWDPPASSPVPVAGYKVYYGNASGQYSKVFDVGNQTNYRVTGLLRSNRYYFAVTDYDSYGNESGYSNEVAYTVPPSDLSGDNDPDIVWHNQVTGGVFVSFLEMANFTGGSSLTPGRIPVQCQIRGLADFDRDGNLDLLLHNQKTGVLTVWLMDGAQRKERDHLTPGVMSNLNWQVRAVADFDGDGNVDILWQNIKTGSLQVWIMDRLTRSRSWNLSTKMPSTNWQVRAASDFNADSSPDILWQNMQTGSLYVWFMKGLQRKSARYLAPKRVADTLWQVRFAADFNKDGKTDILWQHQTSGALNLWTMNGPVRSDSEYLVPDRTFGTNWQIVVR